MRKSYTIILDYLGIETELLFSSGLSNNKGLKGKDKILDICLLLGANEYYNAIGGQELYDRQEFTDNGIKLGFVEPTLLPYPQLSKEFLPGLSIIDMLMMNSKEDAYKQISNCNIV